jgi:hypothetical protein
MRSQFTGQSRVAGWIGGVGLVAVGFIVGQLTHSPTSYAQQEQAAPSPPAKSESATRVVAYIHGSIPITREEYGEFLIARANYNQLEKLVNRRILEIECEKKGFFVTPEEVEAYHNEYVASLQLNSPEDFHKRILPQKNLTMFEWKEDVIKPQLMVMKLLRDSIRVTEKDLQDVYDCRYGPKVDCRMIFLPAGQNSDREVLRMYEKVRVSQEAFELEAQRQPLASLAAAGWPNPADQPQHERPQRTDREGGVQAATRRREPAHLDLARHRHPPLLQAHSARYDQVLRRGARQPGERGHRPQDGRRSPEVPGPAARASQPELHLAAPDHQRRAEAQRREGNPGATPKNK